jgi:glycine/D-amino acid oxidase-like deaminating enzyme
MAVSDKDRLNKQKGGDTVPRTIAGFRAPRGTVVFGGFPATRCADASLPEHLATFLEAHPATFLVEGTEIVHVASDGDSHRLDAHDGRRFSARRVALCLGPWLARHSPVPIGVSPPIRTKKVVSLHVPIEPQSDASVVYLFDHDASVADGFSAFDRNIGIVNRKSHDCASTPPISSALGA